MASKFFEHFIGITDAMNTIGETALGRGGCFITTNSRRRAVGNPLKTRSLVGRFSADSRRCQRPRRSKECPAQKTHGVVLKLPRRLSADDHLLRTLLAFLPPDARCATHDRLVRALRHMLNENEFLSSYGLASRSRASIATSHTFVAGHEEHRVDYVTRRRHQLPLRGT
jgi:16S rRNA G1207 methylase RsmC